MCKIFLKQKRKRHTQHQLQKRENGLSSLASTRITLLIFYHVKLKRIFKNNVLHFFYIYILSCIWRLKYFIVYNVLAYFSAHALAYN